MKNTAFVRPSDKQSEQYGPDAVQRMLDWNVILEHEDGVTVAAGDFAAVPGESWKHEASALQRGLSPETPLNGGEVGASAVQAALLSPLARNKRGPELVRYLSHALAMACIEADPRGLPKDLTEARQAAAKDRQYTPTGYLLAATIRTVDRDTAEIDVTQMGDVFMALDTGGRIPTVLEGSLEQRAYDGEMILGVEKKIDLFKGELKSWISQKYPDVSDQYFYDLIFDRSRMRPQFFPVHKGDLQVFAAAVTAELRTYACTKYAAEGLTPALFDAMIDKGMTPWQQLIAQNNADAGPFWYPALDMVGDTPEKGVSTLRLRLNNLLASPQPRLVIWTDGSAPTTQRGITSESLRGINAYGERTQLEVTGIGS